MVFHESKDQFYSELENKIKRKKLTSDEFIEFIQAFKDPFDSGFYELCSTFSDISLNAVKQADPVTCDVQACFNYSDCDKAKAAFKNYVNSHKMTEVDGLFEAIYQMHRYAVARDDTRCKGGRIVPKDYDWKPGFGGKYHNFCKLPEDIWKQIADDIRKELK